MSFIRTNGNELYKERFAKFLANLRGVIATYLLMGNSHHNYDWLRNEVCKLLDHHFFFCMELVALVQWFNLGKYEANQLNFDDTADMIAGCITCDLNEIELEYYRSVLNS